MLRAWTRERGGLAADPLFPTRTGRRLSADAVQRRVTLHVAVAKERCPSLAGKNVTPHVLRHTAAMALLQAGVDVSVIALWLGHEDIRSTQAYLHADLAIKERALARTTPNSATPGTIQALGPAPRLPRGPVIMPTPDDPKPSRSPPAAQRVGIIPVSA